MTDKRRNKIECRSKEGLEADVPMRAISYGPIGESENILNCNSDDFTETVLDENGEDVPPYFINVDH